VEELMNTTEKKIIRQKHFGDKSFVCFIAFLSAFVPVATDLYMPALPSMVEGFNTTTSILNLTLILYFVFYAGGMLLWGPLSDRYGRKIILLIGLISFTIASILCAISSTVEQLIIFRVIQAIASGAVSSVGTAIVKDVYSGQKRVSILAMVQSSVMLTPIIAPILGAFVLQYTSWQGEFWILAIMSAVALIGGAAMEETILNRNNGNIAQTFGRLWGVLKNPNFASILGTFAIQSAPMMAYISMSSYIYVDGFKLSEQMYSYFYAFNAIFLIIGPMLYLKLANNYKLNSIITISLIVVIASGILVFTIGRFSPWQFALTLFPATLAGSIIKPPSVNLLLDQQEGDARVASSLNSCGSTLCGSFGMMIISLNLGNPIIILGLMYMFFGIISLILWWRINNKLSTSYSSNINSYRSDENLA
jgi:DHA1 family bicyclomycin/chloramphenicol resistance-like MFS transporter